MRARPSLLVVLTTALAAVLALLTPNIAAAEEQDTWLGPLVVGQRIINGDGDTSGKCLDYEGAGTGLYAQMWACNGGRQQDWNYVQVSGNVYEIRTRIANNPYPCVDGPSAQQGTRVVMTGCTTTSSLWVAENFPNGWVRWRNYWSGLCMDVRGGGTTNVIQMWPCLDQGNQKWHIY
jgi:hypothetical protein